MDSRSVTEQKFLIEEWLRGLDPSLAKEFAGEADLCGLKDFLRFQVGEELAALVESIAPERAACPKDINIIKAPATEAISAEGLLLYTMQLCMFLSISGFRPAVVNLHSDQIDPYSAAEAVPVNYGDGTGMENESFWWVGYAADVSAEFARTEPYLPNTAVIVLTCENTDLSDVACLIGGSAGRRDATDILGETLGENAVVVLLSSKSV